MRDLVDTTEMYLRTIYELEEEGIPPLRARIAERLDQSGPTVSQTVARMERDGLLSIQPDRSLKLSDEGRALATAVMRKHRLAERLLTDVIGLPWEKVHDEACRWEHVMGDEVERRLVKVLDEFSTSPFGNPIPGLADIVEEEAAPASTDTAGASPASAPGVRGSDVDADDPVEVTIVSFNEIVQLEHKIMAKLSTLGINPGSQVRMHATDDGLVLTGDNGSVTVPHELGHAIRVIP
ncbi:metal-dependent transcriptional regulator [Corynebacterium heidelbergense]|uniref:Diphtheria toxin repressor n=1 Tax=Corynebacterium heidelbergense TaxID=2055947 RepID=A0A364VCL9_9CORY|nr:metal-dependent transcriptional regulator [Corynebacterium heidelbergense]RAV34381.1 metal-dependent regulator [Corynebacterium heidelbergense]WCZ36676.1 Diphtheria toxin repressor [Corynebacterium heidelbergense]